VCHVSLPSSYRSRRGHIHLLRVLPLVGCWSKTPTMSKRADGWRLASGGTRCGSGRTERRCGKAFSPHDDELARALGDGQAAAGEVYAGGPRCVTTAASSVEEEADPVNKNRCTNKLRVQSRSEIGELGTLHRRRGGSGGGNGVAAGAQRWQSACEGEVVRELECFQRGGALEVHI
jgi:hypothetical protein